MAALLISCAAAAGSPDAGTGSDRLANGIPLALLSSAYLHVKDAGTTTSEQQMAKLLFHPSGAAFLILDVEGQRLRAFQGSFSYRSADRLFDIVGDLCTALVRARGVDASATVPFLERYVQLFVHRAGSPAIDLSPAPRVLSMTAFRVSEGAFGVDVEDPGWGGRVGGDYSSCFTDE